MTEREIARLTIDVSFQGELTVTLFDIQTGNNNLTSVITCNSNLYPNERQSQRLTISRNRIEKILHELKEAHVPVLPKEAMGCDGTTYELTLTRGLNDVTYRWWCEAPEGYEPVVKFANELLKLARCDEQVTIL